MTAITATVRKISTRTATLSETSPEQAVEAKRRAKEKGKVKASRRIGTEAQDNKMTEMAETGVVPLASRLDSILPEGP